MPISNINSMNNSDRNYIDTLTGKVDTNANKFNAEFSNDYNSSLDVTDFFNLMITQLTNQDFTNTVDDTQYVAQLAQFSTLSAMQEMEKHSERNYVLNLLGKTCTASTYKVGGETVTTTGKVTAISLVNNDYKLTIDGKQFSMSEITSVSDNSQPEQPEESEK